MSLYHHVSVVAPGMALRRRAALLATARSLGVTTSVDAELRAARERLADLEESVPSLAAARRRVAETGADLEGHRERVATLRGRLRERDDEALAEEYRGAIRSLSEAETEHAAAREALADARSAARSARDVRERRLSLEDRIGNLERTAREERVRQVRPAVEEALVDLPGRTVGAFPEADPVAAALAVVRVGRVRIPIVLACRRFPDAPTAESWLGTPVYRL